MKLAVLIAGHLRGFKNCLDFLKTLSSKHTVDVYLNTSLELKGLFEDDNKQNFITEKEIEKEYKDTKINKIVIKIDDNEEKLSFDVNQCRLDDTTDKQVKQMERVIFMWRRCYKAFNMLKEQKEKYDLYIRTRPDIICPGDILLKEIEQAEEDKLYLIEHNQNDQFWYTKSLDIMEKTCDFCNNLEEIYKYYNGKQKPAFFHTHIITDWYFHNYHKLPIAFSDIKFSIIRQ